MIRFMSRLVTIGEIRTTGLETSGKSIVEIMKSMAEISICLSLATEAVSILSTLGNIRRILAETKELVPTPFGQTKTILFNCRIRSTAAWK